MMRKTSLPMSMPIELRVSGGSPGLLLRVLRWVFADYPHGGKQLVHPISGPGTATLLSAAVLRLDKIAAPKFGGDQLRQCCVASNAVVASAWYR
jgi:hypothetical protein